MSRRALTPGALLTAASEARHGAADAIEAPAAARPSLLRELWEEGRAVRDPFFESAAASGELLVTRVRLLILSLLLVIQLLPGWDPRVHLVGIASMAVALLWALGMFALVRRFYRPWVAFVSSATDVTMVSLGLLGFMLAGRPHVAVNSRVLFEVYFLAIGCAALRYDWRVCALSGGLASLQYAGLMAFAQARWDVRDPGNGLDGVFSWNIQAGRVVLLGAASVLSAALVLRGQRLRRSSTIDRLTGLQNRGAFDERLAQEVSRAHRGGRAWTFALLDIDHFKRFNDCHGHAGGDLALRALSRVLRGSVRREDVLGRYGGDEFALVLPETAPEQAQARMDDLRRAVAALPVLGAPGVGVARITISIGVAGWPADGAVPSEVIAAADVRLYEAKAAGRNRLVGPGGMRV